MSLTGTLALTLGPAIGKTILKLWLNDRETLATVGVGIMDLLAKTGSDVFAKRTAERQFQEIGEKVARNLLTLFEIENAGLDENGKTAVALAVANRLEKTSITADFLIEKRLDPSALARYFVSAEPQLTSGLSRTETELYERVLNESSRYIVDVASQLPTFSEKAFAEIFKRGDQLMGTVEKILEEVRRIQRGSEQGNSDQDSVHFETEYRLAVGRKLDELELFGVDLTSSVNRRHCLSVAYVTLSVRRKEQRSAEKTFRLGSDPDDSGETDDVLAADLVLKHSRRLLVRGQAGSGKTTLLQWIAVRAASRSFGFPLEDWNDLIPFFVRLRDCVETGLPSPEQLPRLVAPSIADEMPDGWVHEKFKNKKAVLLVDGLDEMREHQRPEVRSWLKDIGGAFPDVRIIVSSRPTAIEDNWMDAESFDDAELQPMNLPDIYSFVDHWHRAIAEQLQDEAELNELEGMRTAIRGVVREAPSIRNLATNPLLCAMLCALNRDRKQNLPSDRIELYEACCHMLAERRDKERRVDLKDYPQLSYRQKKPLLEDFAYWLMINGWSVVSKERAEERFNMRLKSMPQLQSVISSSDLLRLFVERTGLLREPQMGHVDFTHRTFQEFLAAQAALDEGNTGSLLKHAHDEQWRELIVLAAGRASSRTRDEIVRGLINRGDQESQHRHRLHLLAVSCLETAVELAPDLVMEVTGRLRRLVPPNSVTEAGMLSSAGDLAIPYLRYQSRFGALQAASSVRALGFIGTPAALEVLETYASDSRQTVIKAQFAAMHNFDPDEFAERIFSKQTQLSWGVDRNLHRFGFFKNLESLLVWYAEWVTDLTPLTVLKNLKFLDLRYCHLLLDLAPLAEIRSLQVLNLEGARSLSDLTPLVKLPKLKSVRVSGTGFQELIIPKEISAITQVHP